MKTTLKDEFYVKVEAEMAPLGVKMTLEDEFSVKVEAEKAPLGVKIRENDFGMSSLHNVKTFP